MKHLDFDLLLVRDQGVGGSNPLSPTILSLDFSITYPTFAARGTKHIEPKTSVKENLKLFV